MHIKVYNKTPENYPDDIASRSKWVMAAQSYRVPENNDTII